MKYLEVAVLVFGLNLLPAFGPLTCTAPVLFKLNRHLDPVALVVIGAAPAGVGRLCLAYGTRHAKKYLSQELVDNMRGGATAADRTPGPICSNCARDTERNKLDNRHPSRKGLYR